MSSVTDVQDKPETVVESVSDVEFQQQKAAFKQIPPLTLERYRGFFVASRDGKIVDSDTNLARLTKRFFSEHGDVAVYIAKIGEPIRVTITTPLR